MSERPHQDVEIAQAAVSLSRQAIASLLIRSGNVEDVLRRSLDVLYRTRALASEDRISEDLALAMLQAAVAEARARPRPGKG